MGKIFSTVLNLSVIVSTVFYLIYYEINPRVYIFVFVIVDCLRYITAKIFLDIHGSRYLSFIKPILRYVTSPPADKNRKEGLLRMVITSKAESLPRHFTLIVVCILMFLPLIYTSDSEDIFTGIREFVLEIQSAWFIALLYWVEEILGRVIVLDFEEKKREVNYTYNSINSSVLLLSVVLSWFLFGIFAMLPLNLSPWCFCGVLMFFKHFADLAPARVIIEPEKQTS